MIGFFLVVGYLRLHQSERWARGLFFVALSVVGFMGLSILQFVENFGTPGGFGMFLYAIPLVCLAIGTYLISTSDIRAHER